MNEKGIYNHETIPSGTRFVSSKSIHKFELQVGDRVSIIRSDGTFDKYKTISSIVHGQYYELLNTNGFIGMSNIALVDLDVQFNMGKGMVLFQF